LQTKVTNEVVNLWKEAATGISDKKVIRRGSIRYVCLCVYVYVYVYVCACACVCVCVVTCVCECIYVCVFVCVRVSDW